MNMFRTSFGRRVLAQPFQAPITRSVRPFSQRNQTLARKDTQDKDSMKIEPNEYSKSGSDNAAAEVSDTAFDPDQTSPEEQHDSAGQESEKDSNPLSMSPANHGVSKGKPNEDKGGSSAESGKGPSDRARTSGGGSPNKNAGGQKYSS